MSKCREAFEQWLCTTASQSPVDIWQNAWNAATQNALIVCEATVCDCCTWAEEAKEARDEICTAIEQEIEK